MLAATRSPLVVLCFLIHAAVNGQFLRGLGETKIVTPIPHGRHVAMSCRGKALRLQLIPPHGRPPLATPMLSPVVHPEACGQVTIGEEEGVATSLGTLTVNHLGEVHIRSPGGNLVTSSLPIASDHDLVFKHHKGRLLGGGSNSPGGMSLSTHNVNPQVGNTGVYAPYYYSEDGYSILCVVEHTDVNRYPANYELKEYGSENTVHWSFTGLWDCYIMPAASLQVGTEAYYDLTGRAPVPPRYAFGFIASRWGWKDRVYIEDTLQRFRDGKFPIDGIIIDFEWFTNETDYGFEPGEGRSYYHDFSFNDVLFPEPSYQLADYNLRYNVHVSGIRKPRIGNTKLLEELDEKGWISPHCEPAGRSPPLYPGYACGRNINFDLPEARNWYSDALLPLIHAGMSFWWNDEGEPDYFTFHRWNEAEKMAQQKALPEHRFFSLNRAFSPGMSRLGATVWTGDVTAEWSWLQNTPGTMLNWVLAGAPIVSCDTGGFVGNSTAELLIRWLQVACFMPVMRVHSEKQVTPHFPWLWGDQAEDAIREILNLRYRLLPYHYSLAHSQYATGRLWIRPLTMDYPDVAEVRNVTTQWMDGLIMVAPVLRNDSTHDVVLPPGLWYRFDRALKLSEQAKGLNVGEVLEEQELLLVHSTGNVVKNRFVPLKEVPSYVRPGSILPLSPVVQHSGEIGSLPLEVFIFGDQDGHFALVEDDGFSKRYLTGEFSVANLHWTDGTKTLSWEKSGFAPQGFTQIIGYFINVAGQLQKSPVVDFNSAGSISFPSQGDAALFQ